jgi:hypothetical protein
MSDAHIELLLAIARENLGIETFELTGKASGDFRIVSVDDVCRALEAAYDAGLVVGHSVTRGLPGGAHALNCTVEECDACGR